MDPLLLLGLMEALDIPSCNLHFLTHTVCVRPRRPIGATSSHSRSKLGAECDVVGSEVSALCPSPSVLDVVVDVVVLVDEGSTLEAWRLAHCF